MLGNCIDNVRKSVPLVHNITNYVTVMMWQMYFWHVEEVRLCQMNQRMWKILLPSAGD